MKLPEKIKTASLETSSCVRTINEIIDYLKEEEGKKGVEVAINRIRELVKPTSVWDLERGDTCYCINSKGKISQTQMSNTNEERREVGNIFLTKEAAETEKKSRIEFAQRKYFN